MDDRSELCRAGNPAFTAGHSHACPALRFSSPGDTLVRTLAAACSYIIYLFSRFSPRTRQKKPLCSIHTEPFACCCDTKFPTKPVQRHYIRILWMVPIYSVESWLALRFNRQKVYLETAREAYEAYVVYSLYKLMREYLGDKPRVCVFPHGRRPCLACICVLYSNS